MAVNLEFIRNAKTFSVGITKGDAASPTVELLYKMQGETDDEYQPFEYWEDLPKGFLTISAEARTMNSYQFDTISLAKS